MKQKKVMKLIRVKEDEMKEAKRYADKLKMAS